MIDLYLVSAGRRFKSFSVYPYNILILTIQNNTTKAKNIKTIVIVEDGEVNDAGGDMVLLLLLLLSKLAVELFIVVAASLLFLDTVLLALISCKMLKGPLMSMSIALRQYIMFQCNF
jgi:hypothetical protein